VNDTTKKLRSAVESAAARVTDGNKFEPGQLTTRPRVGQGGLITADDVRDYVLRFAPKLGTDNEDDTTSTGAGTTGDAGSTNAGDGGGDGGSSQSDAA
jgi:hypothetical protein